MNRTAAQCERQARAAIARLTDVPELQGPVDLDAKVRVMHGRELVAELGDDFDEFGREFSRWIDRTAANARG